MKRLRLLHFDVTTKGNYGDNLLFPLVRRTFEQFAGGNAFHVFEHAPLRTPVTPRLIKRINANADAVLLGGGGLFLRDTAELSGWQWAISREALAALKVPLILFAVGNNRFLNQPDFDPIFTDHLRQTVDQSVFVGLRNTGSIQTIRSYLREDQRDRLRLQPCPTTLSERLLPEGPSQRTTPVIGAQLIVGKRQKSEGFDPAAVYTSSLKVLQRLHGDGWTVLSTPFARADLHFAEMLQDSGVAQDQVRLFGARSRLFDGVDLFRHVPFILGNRGHGQMVPFGVNSAPFSVFVHNKLRYFAQDIGRPDWVKDPRSDDFVDQMYHEISHAYDSIDLHQQHLRRKQDEFYDLTVDNLTEIYRKLTGELPVRPVIDRMSEDDRTQVSDQFNRINRPPTGRIRRLLVDARKLAGVPAVSHSLALPRTAPAGPNSSGAQTGNGPRGGN